MASLSQIMELVQDWKKSNTNSIWASWWNDFLAQEETIPQSAISEP
jgi:hypothetical protein